ncbi:MAG: methyltransferase domain-containing protein [Oscillospiraceae bacterium]|nr:methyltransferase domain-containing protein [Oscillospiraceae bacterium]
MVTKCISGDAWRASMQQPFGDYSDRVRDVEVEKAFWRRVTQEKQSVEPDPYSIVIANKICELLSNEYDIQSIIELGPGWGNYTFKLAELCSRLICVDISQDNLDRLRQIAFKKGISGIETVCCEWENCEPPSCDAIFAYNCFYRMRSIEDCLLKINNCAQKICIIGMNESPEQPFLPALERELGLPVRYTRLDYRHLEIILRELGIVATVIEIPNERVYAYDSMESLLVMAARYIQGEFDKPAAQKILKRYYKIRDGPVVRRHAFRSGLLIWRPSQ